MDLKGLSDSLSSRAQQSVCNWFVLDADADPWWICRDCTNRSHAVGDFFAPSGFFLI